MTDAPIWTDLDLDDHHRRMLQDSGVTPLVAHDRGYRTVREPSDVPSMFNATQRKLVPALLIPVYGVDDTSDPIAYELRPDHPRTDGRTGRFGKEPKVRKYEYPAGAPKRLDVPRSVRTLLGSPATALWITEGARKADAAASRGMLAVSIAGVWAFRSTNVDGGKVELADFDAIALNGRDVMVAFDSDVVSKPEVRRALHRLKGVLERRGASVSVVVLPPGPRGAKNGLDDLLASGAEEADLLKLVDPSFLDGDDRSLEQQLYDFIRDAYELGQDSDGNGFAVPRDPGDRRVRMLYTDRPSLELEAPHSFYHGGKNRPIVPQRVTRDVMRMIAKDCEKQPRQELYLRTAPCQGGVVIDLGDETGRMVAVSASGWAVVDKPPAHFPLFRRTSRTRPLPMPEPGGDLGELRELMNVTDTTWPLVMGWLIACVFGWIARPWLFHTGPQGSGKSDAAVMVVGVLDPRSALSAAPRKGDRSDLPALASASYLLGMDNLSHIPGELSDWFCSLVTGGEDTRRILNTTAQTVSLTYMRTGVLTGISLSGLRPDLLERLVPVEFGRIEPTKRRLHAEVTAKFEAARGRLLGAVLDAVATVLKHLPEVDSTTLDVPRMTDYAAVLRAYDIGTGTDLFGAYREVVGESFTEAADEDPVAAVVLSYMDGRKAAVKMTPTDLLKSLTVHRLTMHQADDAYWPKTPKELSTALVRLAAMLEGRYQVARIKHSGVRYLTITPVEREPVSVPVEAPASPGSSPAASTVNMQVDSSFLVSRDSRDSLSITNKEEQTQSTEKEHVCVCFPRADGSPVPFGPCVTSDPPQQTDPLTGKPVDTCSVCRLRMVTVEPGQTTHPMCDPSDVDGMDDDEVQQHALALLARELGAEKVPTQTPEWVSTFAKKQLAAQRKGTSAAKTLGLPGRLAAVGVGSVSAKVTWDIPSHRDRLTADQQEQIRDIARRYATRHRDAHRSAASAPPAVSASYVLVVLSRADLDAFLVELTLVVKGAP